MVRRGLFLALPPSLGLVLALGVALPASAALPSGPVQSYSVQTTLPWLASCASFTGAITEVGGWSQQAFFSAGQSTTAPAATVVPVQTRLSEPCIGASGGLEVVVNPTSSKLTREASEVWAPASFVLDGIQCVTSTGSEYTRTTLFHSQNVPTTATTLTGRTLTMGNIATNFSTNCARLIYLEGYATTYLSNGSPVYSQFSWSASRFLGNAEYGDQRPDNLVQWCQDPVNSSSDICFGLVDPDPTSWDSTCGNTANNGNYGFDFVQFNPIDPATYGPATGWLAACLLVPLVEYGGFDRNGDLADAWAASPNAEAGSQLVGLAESFHYAPGCGPLFGSSETLPGFSVNTCSWTWAAPVKSLLAVGVLLAGVLWFINFIARTSWSLMRNAPSSPLEGDSK